MSFKASSNARNNINNKTNAKTQQPFCKVCFDAKRNDYNTHFLKDFSGPEPIVLCPYLLALKCNYCKEQGHTVSYCEILKAKKEGEIALAQQQQQSKAKVPSQNGNFFILRVSSDKKETVTYSTRKTVGTVSEKKVVSTANNFSLLEVEDEEEWEMPKYNKTRKTDIVSLPREEVAVAVAVAVEAEPVEEVVAVPSGPTWAKIVAAPAPKKTALVLSTKDVASLFVTRQETTTPAAAYEKPMPKFIHATTSVHASKSSSTDDNVKIEKCEKYFTAPAFTRDWADESSDEDGGW